MLPHINDFLVSLQASHYSPLTVRNYKGYLEVFDRFLDESHVPFDEIDRQTITSYKEYLASSGRKTEEQGKYSNKQLAPCTINYKLIGLRVYLRYLIGIDYPCPLAPEAVELKDLIRLIEAPSPNANIIELRDKAILETLFNTGLKVSEVVSLNPDQLSLERKQIGLKGKGDKIRVVFLSDTVTECIRHYLQSRRDHFEPLFIRHSGKLDTWRSGQKMRLTVRSVQRIVIKYAKRCGLSINVTPQTLRHCFATYLIEEAANPVPLQVLFSHESLYGITRYVHTSDRYAEETHHAYHPLSKQD